MSMTATPQAPPTEQVFGIAKKMTLELEKLPLHTHATIVNMLRMTVEHRKVEMDNQVAETQVRANEAAMTDARRAHAEAQVARDAQIAAQLVTHAEAKAPRLSIVLDKPGNPSAEDLDAVEAERQTAGATAPAEEAVAQ